MGGRAAARELTAKQNSSYDQNRFNLNIITISSNKTMGVHHKSGLLLVFVLNWNLGGSDWYSDPTTGLFLKASKLTYDSVLFALLTELTLL